MDEDKGVKDEGEVKLPEESPTLEETTEEVPEVKEESAEETKPTETETAESKGANQRIRELNEAKKLAEEKAQSLEQRLAEITQPIGSEALPQYQPQYTEGQEVSPEQLQQDITSSANAIVELKIKQNNAINRINNESRDVVRKYPQLDPDNEVFDKELSDTVTEATEAMVRANPYSASVEKFVDKLMKPYQRSVTKEVGKATENIAKQVSEATLRPTSVRGEEKTAKEKSIAELEQELGVVQA